jgi:NADH dehydrogenase FAD-containing subunit
MRCEACTAAVLQNCTTCSVDHAIHSLVCLLQDATLRVLGHTRVFALGDIAVADQVGCDPDASKPTTQQSHAQTGYLAGLPTAVNGMGCT